jgi:hypothetical protein
MASIASSMKSVPIEPSGSKPASSATGLAENGRATARRNAAATSAVGGNRFDPLRWGGLLGGPTPRNR